MNGVVAIPHVESKGITHFFSAPLHSVSLVAFIYPTGPGM